MKTDTKVFVIMVVILLAIWFALYISRATRAPRIMGQPTLRTRDPRREDVRAWSQRR